MPLALWRGFLAPCRTVAKVRPAGFDYVSNVQRPTWRGVLHAATALVTVPAGTIMAAVTHGVAIVATIVFSATLALTFGVSACYHRLARTVRSQHIMRRVDHAGIYLLIAGTYTPICLLGMPNRWGITMLVVVWVGALCGVALKLSGRAWRTGTALYLVLGWLAAIALPVLWMTSGPVVAGLVVLGGLIYTAGAVGFATHRPKLAPATFGYHEMWHVATILAAGTHFAAVVLLAA